MGYDKQANKYLDKVFPETRQVTAGDLERVGIKPEMHAQAQQIVSEYEQTHGVKPTVDQVVVEFRRREMAARRRGI